MLFTIFLLIGLVVHGEQIHGFTEWQSGIDRTINEQKELSQKSSYPINIFQKIQFPKGFSRIPNVLLMHEELQWNRNRDVDFYVHASNIDIKGFTLNYHIGGPAFITKMKVRWLAILDSSVEIQYIDYGFNELIKLRQGFGRRVNEFEIDYIGTHFPKPNIVAFITGVKMAVDDSESYALEVRVGHPGARSVNLEFKTRDFCHVKGIKVALLITTSKDAIIAHGSANADKSNAFAEPQNQVTRRHEKFHHEVPYSFTLQPHHNILAQGITGFDVDSKRGEFYIKVGNEYINDQKYHMSYGTQGNTVLYKLQYSLVLRSPALPRVVFMEEFIHNNFDSEVMIQIKDKD